MFVLPALSHADHLASPSSSPPTSFPIPYPGESEAASGSPAGQAVDIANQDDVPLLRL